MEGKNNNKKKNSREVTNEGTLGGFLYMMHEEANLTLKVKKKKMRWEGGRVGGWFLLPRV